MSLKDTAKWMVPLTCVRVGVSVVVMHMTQFKAVLFSAVRGELNIQCNLNVKRRFIPMRIKLPL